MESRQVILTVLVVEDEWLVRADVAAYLRSGGCRVIEAADGETALALIENGAPLDVLFTDIALGGRIDGWELGEKLRVHRPRAGVIYASGCYSDPCRPVAGRWRSPTIATKFCARVTACAVRARCALRPDAATLIGRARPRRSRR